MPNETRQLRLDTIELSENPLDYYPDEGLLKAFEIAIALGKPLLISGEPGTGKTRFAHWAARALSLQTGGAAGAFLPSPFVYPVKSTSQATDLFYNYDAIGHFRSGQGAAQPFITLQALGQALVETHEADAPALAALQGIRNARKLMGAGPQSSVVLIDEIDKAPREFPNDLLHEIENNTCWIPELSCSLHRSADKASRIAVVITSNSEKNLPNAFLRRCVFYHINFPEDMLLKIARLKLKINDNTYDTRINTAIAEFQRMRNLATNKKPTTSEFLDWLGVLMEQKLLEENGLPLGIPGANPGEEARRLSYRASLSTLLKTVDDLRAIES